MTPQEMSRPNKGYTKHERLAKMSMTAPDLEQQSQRQQISRETAAMQREIHGLQRPGRLVDCGDGKLASVSVMTLPRKITRGQQCAYLAERQLRCRRTQFLLVSGYDFKAPENYPKDAAQGREALFDGLCWKLLPTLGFNLQTRQPRDGVARTPSLGVWV